MVCCVQTSSSSSINSSASVSELIASYRLAYVYTMAVTMNALCPYYGSSCIITMHTLWLANVSAGLITMYTLRITLVSAGSYYG